MRVQNYTGWRVLHFSDHVIKDYQLLYIPKPERDAIFQEIVYGTWRDHDGVLHLDLYEKCPKELALQRAIK